MCTNYKNRYEIKEKLEVKISYDNYYPNKIIVTEIKKQLKKHNIKVKLVETDYFNPKEIADFRLYLFSNEFNDEIFKYYFLSLISCLSLNKDDFRKTMNIVKNYFNSTSNYNQTVSDLKKILIANGVYFSIGEIKSTFLSKDHKIDFIYNK